MRCASVGLALLALLAAGPALAFKRTVEGDPVKDFVLPSAEGEELRLSERLGSKATLVLFWAGWSPRSAEALNEYQELYEAYESEGLAVIAVDVEGQDHGDDELQQLVAMTRELELEFPVVFDRNLTVFDQYGVIAVPSTVLADGEGRIVALLEGYSNMTRGAFKEKILEVLGVIQVQEERPAEAARYVPQGKAARYYSMGDLLAQRGLLRKAERALENAVREDPEYAQAHRRLAEVLEAQGKGTEAAQARKRLAELEPEAAETRPDQAGVEGEGAGDAASPGKGPDPAAERYVRMGTLLLANGSAAAAEAAFRNAVERDPGYREAYARLAEALQAQGMETEAAEARQQARELERGAAAGPGKE